MKRLMLSGMWVLSAAVLNCVLLLTLLLYSPRFNQWLVFQVTGMVPGLSIDQFDGLLLSDTNLQGLKYQNEQVDISILSASYRLSLTDLLLRKIQFEYLHASHVDVLLLEAKQPEEQEPETSPFIMPVTLQLDDFTLKHLQIKQKESVYLLETISFALLYQGQQLQLSQFGMQSEMIQAQGDAELKLDSRLPFAVDLQLAKSIPDLADIKAHLVLQGDSQKVNLNMDILAPNEVHAQGQVLFNEEDMPRFNLSFAWSLLQWPMQGPKQYASENTRLTVQGTAQDYLVNLESDIFAKDLATGKLFLVGEGDSEQLTLKTLSLKALSGEIESQGRISWTDSIPSQLQLQADNLQLSSLLAGYSSELSLVAHLSGRLFNAPDFRVLLKEVHGSVLDKPVDAKAYIHYSAAQLLIEQLHASVGDNSLVVQGLVGNNNSVDFTLDAGDLHELSSDLHGAVFTQGSLQGSMKKPAVTFEILSDGLKFQQQQLGSLYAKGGVETAGEGSIDLTVNAEQLLVNGKKINKVELQSKGEFAQHHLTALVGSEQGGVELALQGGWMEQTNSWQGRIKQLKVQGTSAGTWQLIKPAPMNIVLAQQSMQLETDLCVAQISGTGLVCLMATADQHQLFSGTIKQLPLSALADWVPETWQINSYLQATFSLQNTSELTGEIDLSIDPGSIRLEHEQTGTQIVAFKRAEFDVKLLADTLQSNLLVLFNEVNEIAGQLKMTGLGDTTTASIEGLLNITLEDISFLGAFVESVNEIGGEVDMQLVLQGLLSEPKLNGSKMNLAQGQLSVPEIGLRVDDINIELKHAEGQQIALLGKAKIAEQQIVMEGLLDQYISDQVKFQMTIKGDDLKLMQVPEMQAWVSPDLRLKGDKNGAKLEGEVTIPKATLVFESLPAGAVALSDDEVIINAKKSEPKVSRYPLDADINILLGESVSLEGFGLKTQLRGQLHAIQKKNQLKLYNELHSVKGTYQAYGQDLTIEKGQLLFNGDMENPGINILASRKASDWEDKTIAYLRMSGTLKKPVTTVYTEPALSESEALAYLLTGAPLGKSDSSNTALLAAAALSLGRDYVDALMGVIGVDEFDMKSTNLGQNSMVIGKRISTDLYARYIMDVLTSQMQFAVIYMLTQNISIETRAGTTHSSDIKYNIEFD